MIDAESMSIMLREREEERKKGGKKERKKERTKEERTVEPDSINKCNPQNLQPLQPW